MSGYSEKFLSPLKAVGQTNKLLIIEEFSKEQENLIDLWGSNRSRDEKLIEIYEKLSVSSFEEFIQKFTPKLYQWNVFAPGPQRYTPMYSLKKPNDVADVTEIDLTQESYFKSLLDLYDAKKRSGDNNLKQDYSNVAKNLNPEYIADEARDKRDKLQKAYKKYKELKASHAADCEISAQVEYIKGLRIATRRLYDNGYVGLLALAAADSKAVVDKFAEIEKNQCLALKSTSGEERLLAEGKKIAQLPLSDKETKLLESGHDEQKLLQEGQQQNTALMLVDDEGREISTGSPVKVCFDRNGNVKLVSVESLPIVSDKANGVNAETLISNEVTALVAKDFMTSNLAKKFTGESMEFVKAVVLEALTPNKYLRNVENKDKAVEIYEGFVNYYKAYQEGLIREVSKVVQKLLDVKVFFDHATVNGRLDTDSKVIIANCSAEYLVKVDNYDLFKDYVKQVGGESGKNKLCFALIPGVVDKKFNIVAKSAKIRYQTELGDLDSDDVVDDSNEDAGISISTLKKLADEFEKNKIVLFFNYVANNGTGVSSLNVETVKNYRESLKCLDGMEHIVFAFPNFTLLPEKFSKVKFDRFYIDGVGQYIDAAYVAAGLTVGIQNPKYLEERGEKFKWEVCPDYPGVRFDFAEHDTQILTYMNCESVSENFEDVKVELRKKSFGFCFMSYPVGGLRNAYVYKSRTMGYEKDGKDHLPLFKVLTMDFVERYLNANPSIVKNVDNKQNFEKTMLNRWKNEADNGTYVNNILHKGEDVVIELADTDAKITVNFCGGPVDRKISVERN